MADLHKGKLATRTLKGGKIQLIIHVPTKKGTDPRDARVALSTDLAALPDAQLDGVEVEFEIEGGQVARIRRAGESFVAPAATRPTPKPGGDRGFKPPYAKDQGAARRAGADATADFHNPYNFIPAPPRSPADRDLGDANGKLHGHHYLYPDCFSGTIEVEMTAQAPLIVPDAASATRRDGHQTFDLRFGDDGKPLLPVTAVKGMLRSAYEAITNSRFGIFRDHDRRLAYRMDAREGLALVPARVRATAIELLLGTTPDVPELNKNGRWQIPGGLMYAAWLRRYRAKAGGLAADAVKYGDGTLPQHGDEAWAWVERVAHVQQKSGKIDFHYWSVRRIARREQDLGPAPNSSPDAAAPRKVYGFVCVTNQNIDRKHDERLFFIDDAHPRKKQLTIELNTAPATHPLGQAWRNLVRDYQLAHDEKEVWKRGPKNNPKRPEDYLGREPGNTAWSRHIYLDGDKRRDNQQPQVDAAELAPDTLCYARVRPKGSGYEIVALYPVMIARELFTSAPAELLDESLRPATSLVELSPADRLFGWVNQDGAGAYRGKLRIGPVRCESSKDDAVQRFAGAGVPLAILGEPKPQQAAFYGAADKNGTPLADGSAKQDGYRGGGGLRGRKVYPHHNGLPPEHWEDAAESRSGKRGGYHQEYRHGGNARSDQNRSVSAWVKPGARFSFRVDATNLSECELGALLWLLRLGEDGKHFLRFGGAKPLGLGSVALRLRRIDLRDGRQWRAAYAQLGPGAPPPDAGAGRDDVRWRRAIEVFQTAAQRMGRTASFDGVRFIEAFLASCSGFGDKLPVHYPRIALAPDPEGKSYEWFVQNNSQSKRALPALTRNEKGLPFGP